MLIDRTSIISKKQANYNELACFRSFFEPFLEK